MNWLPLIRVGLAALPLAAYLIWLGWRNIGPHPKLGSGAVDLAALLLGLAGIIAIGPAWHLVAASRTGPESWQLAGLMVLIAAWIGLAAGREIDSFVVYNCTPEQLWPALAGALDELALPYRRHPDHVDLADGTVRLMVEFFEPLRSVTVYVRPPAADDVRRQLADRLRAHLARSRHGGYAIGWAFLLAGCVILGAAGCLILVDTGML